MAGDLALGLSFRVAKWQHLGHANDVRALRRRLGTRVDASLFEHGHDKQDAASAARRELKPLEKALERLATKPGRIVVGTSSSPNRTPLDPGQSRHTSRLRLLQVPKISR